MDTEEFKRRAGQREYIAAGSEMHLLMHRAAAEAQRITAVINGGFHAQEELRALFSQLTGREPGEGFALFPPFYTDFGKNIAVGRGVFINAGCCFQDQGGIEIGDGCLIGHQVVIATLGHDLDPANRKSMRPAPVRLGRNVWVGSHATILPGVSVGDDGYLYAVINYKDEAGKTKYIWFATGLKERGNRKAAKEILDKALVEFEEQQQAVLDKLERRSKPKEVDKSAATMLFSDYCAQYVESIKTTLFPHVYDLYAHHYIKIFKEYFDKRKLRLIDVTEEELNGFYEDRRAHGLKNLTLKHYNSVLRPALRKAYRDKLIPDNPFDFIEPMKKEKPKISFYDKNEMRQLFEAMHGHKLEIPFMLAAYYGFRRSEVLGLRWSAIDFEHDLISINHKVLVVRKQVYLMDELKTATSYRTLPLIPAIKEMLLKHKAQIEENKKFYGNTYDRRYLDYVCVEENGKIVYPDHMTKKFNELLKEHNLRPIRLHDLRHSCASNLLANGVPMKEIQEWLGHSNFSTTADVYSHLDFSAKVTAAKTIASAYEEKPQPIVVEHREPETQDEMAVFAKAIKEMSELGIEKIEDYLAYKEQQAARGPRKTPPQM